jgi:hypothetical protein
MEKEKKKEKLVKIITSIMFFDLNATRENKTERNNNPDTAYSSLRNLQEHFIKD